METTPPTTEPVTTDTQPLPPLHRRNVLHTHRFTTTDGDTGIELGPEELRVWLDGVTLIHTTKTYQFGALAAHLISLADVIQDAEVHELLVDYIDDARFHRE